MGNHGGREAPTVVISPRARGSRTRLWLARAARVPQVGDGGWPACSLPSDMTAGRHEHVLTA